MRNLLKFQSNEAYQNYYESNNFVTPNISKIIENSDIKFIKEKINYVLEFTSKTNKYLYNKWGSIYFTFGDVYDNTYYFDKVIVDGITYIHEDCTSVDEAYSVYLGDENGKDYIFDLNVQHNYKLYLNKDYIDDIINDLFINYDYVGSDNFNLTGNLILPNCVKNIGSIYYNSYCMCGLGDYTGDLIIPDSVTYINNHAFRNCNFNNILVGSGITTVSGNSINDPSWLQGFVSNSKLNNVVHIKFKGLTNLGDYSLYGSNNSYGFINTIDLPSSITSIGNDILGYSQCNYIIIRSSIPPSLGTDNAWVDDEGYPTIIYVPDESVSLYKETAGWSEKIIYPLSKYTE